MTISRLLPLLIGPRPTKTPSKPDIIEAEEAPEPSAPEPESDKPMTAPDPSAAALRDTPQAPVMPNSVDAVEPDAQKPHPAPGDRVEVPLVAPGMVPREDDYIAVAPDAAPRPEPERQPIRTAEFDIPAHEAENRATRQGN